MVTVTDGLAFDSLPAASRAVTVNVYCVPATSPVTRTFGSLLALTSLPFAKTEYPVTAVLSVAAAQLRSATEGKLVAAAGLPGGVGASRSPVGGFGSRYWYAGSRPALRTMLAGNSAQLPTVGLSAMVSLRLLNCALYCALVVKLRSATMSRPWLSSSHW